MAACGEDARIVVSFKPTLFHMSLAKLAVRLYNEFGFEIVEKALAEMEYGNVPECDEGSPENFPIVRSRVKENLLLIPTLLRSRVLTEVERVANEVLGWIYSHNTIERLDYTKCSLFWRSEGTIDRTKTAQEITQNQNVDITARFEIACMYCLANQVQTLWAELKANGKTEKYEEPSKCGMVPQMLPFWVRWILEGAQVPWTLAAQEFLLPRWFLSSKNSLSSSHFRVLTPGERRFLLPHLGYLCKADDLRFCLYVLTKEEQDKVMESCCIEVLELHMNWPLARDFLKTAEKAWNFLVEYSFCIVLESLLERRDRTDFDFEYLSEEFWKRSPTHFKEYAKNSGSKKISKFIEERRTKRKVDSHDGTESKRFRNNL
ncbi:hypothetical protein AVEN_167413-1 [Araneus ventricosus]|uniref:Uncharacterized protein n=1 Tax=Araneus ventricosus TaxID=182803 RepID=A0A4Y2BJL6_ARAVE|nr:hypothetical protein AVEN_167413-1 [Araneus ventricosus]